MTTRVDPTDADRKELASLLSLSREAATLRAKQRFDESVEPGRPVVLFGAGSLGRRTARGLKALGIDIAAFSDNNSMMWGTEVDGVPILSPVNASSQWAHQATFVITIWQGGNSPHRMAHTRAQLKALGCDHVALAAESYWKYPADFLPYLILDSPERVLEERSAVADAFELACDDRSRRIWLDHLRFRLELDYDRLRRDPGEEYFTHDLVRLQDGELFVDCGAYKGDTIAAFVHHCPRFDRIVAFEPDTLNRTELQRYVATLEKRNRIDIRTEAVSSGCGVIRFADCGDMTSHITAEGVEVPTTSLDIALSNLKPTFIKLDVEGAEAQVLEGVRNTLQRSRPIIAIALEHNSHDLWRVPLKLATLIDDYELHFRHHSEQGFDLVCYAIPAERSI